jgi:hypothetical protein
VRRFPICTAWGSVPFAAVLAAALAAWTPALATGPGDVPDKVRFDLGGMLAEAYTDGGLGSTTAGVGAGINFEDTFDLPGNKSTFRVDLSWRVAKRQFMDFGYFSLDRSGSKTLEEDVEWGDLIYHAGSHVSARFKSNFPYAAWRYSFLDLPQVRISGSAGVDYLTLGVGARANGGVTRPDGTPITGEVDESVRVSFPVPQLGLQVDWNLTRRLAILMYMRQIYVDFAGINGGIGETTARLTWWYARHAGVSAGLDKEDIDLKSYTSGDTKARFRYELRGTSLYFNFAF